MPWKIAIGDFQLLSVGTPHKPLSVAFVLLIAAAALNPTARALVVRSSATLVNPWTREVFCANGEVVPYDVLSIDVGSRAATGRTKGLEEHAVLIRPLERFAEGWERVLERARREGLNAVSVVGGGAAGLELAFAIEHRLRRECAGAAPHVRVLTDARTVVPEYPAAARGRLLRYAVARNVGTHGGAAVTEVGPGYLRLRDAIEFATDATFWVAGAAAPEFIRESGVGTDDRGFLAVNDFMQSVTHPAIFGAGDCATNPANPLPKAGVFAVRAGPALSANLMAALKGGPLERFAPSPRFLALVSCGARYAVGVYGPLSFEGRLAWRWKDRIDRRFVALYSAKALAPPR